MTDTNKLYVYEIGKKTQEIIQITKIHLNQSIDYLLMGEKKQVLQN